MTLTLKLEISPLWKTLKTNLKEITKTYSKRISNLRLILVKWGPNYENTKRKTRTWQEWTMGLPMTKIELPERKKKPNMRSLSLKMVSMPLLEKLNTSESRQIMKRQIFLILLEIEIWCLNTSKKLKRKTSRTRMNSLRNKMRLPNGKNLVAERMRILLIFSNKSIN